MGLTWSPFILSSAIFSLALILLVNILWKSKTTKNQPPGPAGWPVFGNIFDLGPMPHHTMNKLRSKYGNLVWLRLGSVNTLVIQSAKSATELFKFHDLSLSGRKNPLVLTALNFHKGSLAFGQDAAYWRILRRLCTMALHVSKQKGNEQTHLRRKCVDDMIRWIEEDAAASRARGESGEVSLPHILFCTAFNLIGNLTLSRNFVDSQSKEGVEFFDAMDKILRWAGEPNVSEFFPFLKWLDPQGLKRNMVRDMGRAMNIVSRFVKERVQARQSGKEKEKDLLDMLLEYEGDGKDGPAKISESNMITIILEMFIAGTDAPSRSIEWGMTELLRKPESMTKAKEELDRVVGLNRKVEESDIDELPYLQAVVKETLRLHPPIPLVIRTNTSEITNFMGYLIPQNTQFLVNTSAIGKDPDCWEDPLSFKPERFLGSNIEFKGQNFELLPFGTGRRICVGISIADKVVHLGLASLIHSFDWKLGSDVTPETIDMNERMGIVLRKLLPLKAIPTKRIA